jgi:flagellar biosynthesis/type III secretory pathway protein FliH
MAIKIIRQGTARASIVQQLAFSGNVSAAAQPIQPLSWIDLPAIPFAAPHEAPALAESIEPAAESSGLGTPTYEDGLLQGEKIGIEIAERKMEAVLQRYSDAIGEVQRLRSALYTQVEREVVKLAVAVAKKIVHREIQVDHDIVRTLVHVALGRVAEKSTVTLCLNPDDYDYLVEHRAELSQSEGQDISLLADKSIERGGCLIQTNCGDIDARVEEEFHEVEHSFFEGSK